MGVTTGVGVAVAVGEAVGMAVTMVLGVGVVVGIAMGVGVDVGVVVAVGVGVAATAAVAVAVGVGVPVAVAVGVGVGVAVGEELGMAVSVGEGVAVGVGEGEGVGVGVGVAGTDAVQATVPVSQGPGGGWDILSTPAAMPSLGNEPLTVLPKMVCVNPWATGSISMGGNPKFSTTHVHSSSGPVHSGSGTWVAVKVWTVVPSAETVKSTVPQDGLAQPVISPL
jgi:hypothetical protein